MFSMSKRDPHPSAQTKLFAAHHQEGKGRSASGPEWADMLRRALLQPMQHACSGRIWVAHIDHRGQGECAFCTLRAERSGPAPSAYPSEVLVARLRRDLRRFTSHKGWVWFSPWADPFVPAARDLAAPALRAAEELLRSGLDLTLNTRGGLRDASALVTLARRYPGRLRVNIEFFAKDAALVAEWERGVASVSERLALAEALKQAGAEVVATIGPLIPMVNDSAQALSSLGRELRQAGLLEWHLRWIRYASGLVAQVRREVSRSRARMLEGWFHMGRGAGGSLPEIPERVRRTIIARVHEVADKQGAQLLVCRCASSVGRGKCVHGPEVHLVKEQLDLFA